MTTSRLPRLTLAVALAALTGLTLAACGDDAEVVAGGPPPVEPPTRILTLDVSGGFVPVGVAFGSVPALTLLSDGVAITGAPVIAIYPGPLLTPLNSRVVDEAGREAVLAAVRESGLLDGQVDFGQPPLADAPTTTLTVVINGETTTLAANGLQEAMAGDPSLTEAQRDARARLRALVDRLSDLPTLAGPEHVGPEETWTPEAVWLLASPVDPARDTGSDVAPTVQPWTVASVDLAATGEPTLLEGARAFEALPVLSAANTLSRFTQDGVTYEVFARPALPGDEA